MSNDKIIMNNYARNQRMVENTILLLAKFYIYKQRCGEKEINHMEFKRIVKQHRQIESEIAKNNNLISHHELKWENILL